MSDLRQAHDEYRLAVEAARTADTDEARAAAQADQIAKRHALDAALVEAEEAREDNERMAAIEARDRAASIVGSAAKPIAPAIPVDEIRAYANEKRQQLSFTVPFETRTDIIDQTNADSYAGYTVPQTWANKVAMFQVAQSGVLAAGPLILRTATGNQINFPTLTTDASAAAGTQGAAATVTNPVFGTVPLNAYRVDMFMAISDELLADTGVNLEEVLSTLCGRALAVKAAPYYNDTDVGTGSSLPAAVAIGSTLGKTAAGVDTVTLDEVKQLMYSVLPAYRPNGSYVANSDLTIEVALMKDDTGNYLWQPSNMASEPDRLFGHPWYEDAYADVSATANVGCLLFGDFNAAYIVRFARGIEVSFSRDFAFTSFETTLRAAIWHDAATIDTLAVKHLAMA